MSSKWLRRTTCDRCGATAETTHDCHGLKDWPDEYQQLHYPTNKPLDLCHDCYQRFLAYMEEGNDEGSRP